MEKDLISIIIPVFNIENYISKCLDSVINQTYRNIEIIIIDDGSTDNTGKICDEYSKKDKRITVIHKKNGGQSSARNYGLKKCNGKYIEFIDGDDYVDLDITKKLYKNLLIKNADISACCFFEEKKGTLWSHNYSKKEFVSKGKEKFDNLYNEFNPPTISPCCKLYKREIFNNISFKEGHIHEDALIIFDILKEIDSISYVMEPLYYYVHREGSTTHSFNKKRLDCIYSLEYRIGYFKEKGYDDLLNENNYYILSTYFSFISDFYNYDNSFDDINFINNIKKTIKKLAKDLLKSRHLSYKRKINCFILAYFNIRIYSLLLKIIKK